MLRSARLSRIVVYALPLAFVVVSWVISAGFPYYLDSNETFLSYLHARNLEIWNPWQYAWMTAEATDPARPTSEHFYTHQPNAPRYVHYALLRLGVRELSTQVLVISLLATGLTATLLWRLFGSRGLESVALAVVLDYAGFLAWTVNTYRIWMFVLFFGMILAVKRDRPFWYGALTFCVVQLDFGIAAFVVAATGVFALFTHRGHAWRLALAAAIGGIVSLTLFGVQVLQFYGWDGFIHELAITYTRRGTAGEAGGLGRLLFQAWHGPLLLVNMIGRETHNLVVMVLVLWGVLASAFALRRPHLDDTIRFLAHLTLSAVAGAVFASTVLYGYFVDAFVVSVLPLASFLIAPALGMVALEVRALLGRLGGGSRLEWLPALLVLAPLAAASLTHVQPPVAVELFERLQTEYRGSTIVAPNLGPWLANPELAFTMTGGRALRTSDIEVTPDDLRRFESLRDAEGNLTYICLDTVYIRKMAKLGEASVCEIAESRMLRRGHEIVADGFGWTIMRVHPEDHQADAPIVEMTPAQASRWGLVPTTAGP